jgi:hypothetical protein
MEPGYTLFIIRNRTSNLAYVTIMDNSGEVVWYHPSLQLNDLDVRQLDNGDLFIQESSPLNRFLEMNMLGQTVKTLSPPAGHPINPHEGVVTDHGTILYLSDVGVAVSNFPTVLPKDSTNANPPLGTVTVDDNPVVEISATNGALLHAWSLLALMDPTRVTYLTGDTISSFGMDNVHANAIIEDTNDNSLIVSLRDQNSVFKISRSTGQLKWILGPPANWPANFQQYLLTPVGTPFEWNYGQHAPELTPNGTMLLFDDGNWRASPFDPPIAAQNSYSRAVEYSINETAMEVSQVWDSTQAEEDQLFAGILGDADWLPHTRNILATYGYISYINETHPTSNASAWDATMVRLIEYTHEPVPEVVFDLSFWDYGNTSASYRGYFCYRSNRVPDLYTHPAAPVADLAVSEENQVPVLEFTADPTHTYLIQASTDLKNWTNIGAPVEEGTGDFSFEDLDAPQFKTRFYRVVTQ